MGLVLWLVPVLLLAQSYSLDWSTVDGGGGTGTGGVYSVSGTIGQPDAGMMSGTNVSGLSFTLVGGFWGIVAAVQTESAPTLTIERTNGLVKVSWPEPAPNWVLTETNRLVEGTGPLWPVVPVSQYQTNAGRIFILTTPQPMQNRFYQLRKP